MQCLKCRRDLTTTEYYGLHAKCFEAWFHVSPHEEFTALQQKTGGASHSRGDLTDNNTSFFQGKFKKYAAELNGQRYKLKMRQEEAPEIPEVEYLCNQIGAYLNIPVAE